MGRSTKNFVSSEISNFASDTFRLDTGNLWIDGRHGAPVASDEQKFDMFFGDTRTLKLKHAPFFCTEQVIKILGRRDQFQSVEDWISYVRDNYAVRKTFEDFVFETESLVSKNTTSFGPGMSMYGDIDFVYNFYVRIYEFLINFSLLSENILPNIYADLSVNQPNVDPFFFNLITGFGANNINEMLMTNLVNGACSESDVQDFYSKVATQLANTGGALRAQLVERYSNIFFPIENMEILKDVEKYANLSPMFTKIEFRTDSRTEFAQILKDSKLSSSLLKFISLLMQSFVPVDIPVLVTTGQYDVTNPGGVIKLLDPETGGAGSVFSKGATDTTTLGSGATSTRVKEFNLLEWWVAFVSDDLNLGSYTNNEIFMGNQCESVLIAKDIQASFAKILALLIFSGKMQTMIQTYMRNYAQITNGKKCYTEIVAYRVAKYAGTSTTDPIQNVWFPNSNEIDVIKYFDTQVKYNKQYTYVIYAYNLVIGSEYRYTGFEFFSDLNILQMSGDDWANNTEGEEEPTLGTEPANAFEKVLGQDSNPQIDYPTAYFKALDPYGDLAAELGSSGHLVLTTDNDPPPSGGGMRIYNSDQQNGATGEEPEVDPENPVQDFTQIGATFRVRVCPKIKIIETSIFTRTGQIIDAPPVFPDVHIVPLKGIDNKIKINLNTHVGSYLMHPIILNQPGEAEAILRIREAQQLPDTSKIRYTTDDPVKEFEIFRTTKRPQTYSDFSDHYHVGVATDVDTTTIQSASAAAFIDSIEPNVMYYYIFRAIDIHGNFSNPTPVFSLIMVSNDGIIFPLQKIVNLGPILSPRRPSKPFKKMIHIVPSMTQAMVDYSATDLQNIHSATGAEIKLGLEAEGLFGNKFKIRLTSKKTGKQMDLNLEFKNEDQTTKKICK